jgi:hypothetical protein
MGNDIEYKDTHFLEKPKIINIFVLMAGFNEKIQERRLI